MIPADGPVVRPAHPADLDAVAALHARELPDGFFAQLGEAYLRAYHRSFVTSPFALLAVVETAAHVQGFAAATLQPRAHARWVLRRHARELALLGALGLLRRPPLLLLFLRTRLGRYAQGVLRRLRPAAAAVAPQATWAVLSHIAVDPSRRRAGTGAALVAEVRRRAEAEGVQGILVLTDPDGPGPGFYRRLGFEDDGLVRGADEALWHRFRLRLR